MGITGVVGSYYTTYGGIPSRLHNVALVAQLIDGALIAPGKTFSFNGTTGERTAEKGFQEAPVIINGELQTGLGGGICQVSTTVFNAAYEAGSPDRRAHEPRALHLALPAGARRDGQLPGSRPQVHERHRQLAAPAHLRRLRLADRQPVRNASEPASRVERAAAPSHRRTQGEARSRADVAEGQERGTRIRPAGARDERQPDRLLRGRHAAARGQLVLAVPVRAEGHPRGDEAEAQAEDEAAEGRSARAKRSGRRAERPAGVYASSALAITSTNQAGTRVGRRVAESTIACEVWPSATRMPSRSIAYS